MYGIGALLTLVFVKIVSYLLWNTLVVQDLFAGSGLRTVGGLEKYVLGSLFIWAKENL